MRPAWAQSNTGKYPKIIEIFPTDFYLQPAIYNMFVIGEEWNPSDLYATRNAGKTKGEKCDIVTVNSYEVRVY